MPAISSLLASNGHMEALLAAIYGEEPYKILSEEALSFDCDCSEERFLNALSGLPVSDLEEMRTEDQGCDITCQFCRRHYHFTAEQLGGTHP